MSDDHSVFSSAPPRLDEAKKPELDAGDSAIGLAQNAAGVAFQCGTCEHFDNGTCRNPLPKLNGQPVEAEWCCNHYDHDGMKTIIQ